MQNHADKMVVQQQVSTPAPKKRQKQLEDALRSNLLRRKKAVREIDTVATNAADQQQ